MPKYLSNSRTILVKASRQVARRAKAWNATKQLALRRLKRPILLHDEHSPPPASLAMMMWCPGQAPV